MTPGLKVEGWVLAGGLATILGLGVFLVSLPEDSPDPRIQQLEAQVRELQDQLARGEGRFEVCVQTKATVDQNYAECREERDKYWKMSLGLEEGGR